MRCFFETKSIIEPVFWEQLPTQRVSVERSPHNDRVCKEISLQTRSRWGDIPTYTLGVVSCCQQSDILFLPVHTVLYILYVKASRGEGAPQGGSGASPENQYTKMGEAGGPN
jgi:hypothetical protein